MSDPLPLCLVTGANTGIGFEIARGLARTGARVVLACRDPIKGEAARKKIAEDVRHAGVDLLIVDLASQRSIRSAMQEFSAKFNALDVLVNNAGVAVPSRREGVDGIELTFATNVLGYYLITVLLLDSLRRAPAARIINVASMTSNSSGGATIPRPLTRKASKPIGCSPGFWRVKWRAHPSRPTRCLRAR